MAEAGGARRVGIDEEKRGGNERNVWLKGDVGRPRIVMQSGEARDKFLGVRWLPSPGHEPQHQVVCARCAIVEFRSMGPSSVVWGLFGGAP